VISYPAQHEQASPSCRLLEETGEVLVDGLLNGFSINRLLSPEFVPRAPESYLHPHSEQIKIR
jgi:hypothetical protein